VGDATFLCKVHALGCGCIAAGGAAGASSVRQPLRDAAAACTGRSDRVYSAAATLDTYVDSMLVKLEPPGLRGGSKAQVFSLNLLPDDLLIALFAAYGDLKRRYS
jgi:hypothetical protein